MTQLNIESLSIAKVKLCLICMGQCTCFLHAVFINSSQQCSEKTASEEWGNQDTGTLTKSDSKVYLKSYYYCPYFSWTQGLLSAYTVCVHLQVLYITGMFVFLWFIPLPQGISEISEIPALLKRKMHILIFFICTRHISFWKVLEMQPEK